MTRSIPRGGRPGKNHRWLGRLLGCLTWKQPSTRSRSSSSLSDSEVDLPPTHSVSPVFFTDSSRVLHAIGSGHRYHHQHHHHSPAIPSTTTTTTPTSKGTVDPDNNHAPVVLLSVRKTRQFCDLDLDLDPDNLELCDNNNLEALPDRERGRGGGGGRGRRGGAVMDSFGQLEMALFAEGLLEFRDSRASVPVLTIGYGFSNDELRACSKRPVASYYTKDGVKGTRKANANTATTTSTTVPYQQGRERGGIVMEPSKLWTDPAHCLEPLVDGLPASVWLECVEPTLAILVSLNSLRRRRSNLSRKKGLPEMSATNRSRHGDFEVGPIAIFHQPGRIQQMMLLRVDFLNAAANAAAAAADSNNPNSNVNQSAEHTSRRGYNRHRRFRHTPLDEISLGSISNINHYLSESINSWDHNSNNNNISNINHYLSEPINIWDHNSNNNNISNINHYLSEPINSWDHNSNNNNISNINLDEPIMNGILSCVKKSINNRYNWLSRHHTNSYLSQSIRNRENNGNSNSNNISGQFNRIPGNESYGCAQKMEQNSHNVSLPVIQLHSSLSAGEDCSDEVERQKEKCLHLLPCDREMEVNKANERVRINKTLSFQTWERGNSLKRKLKAQNPEIQEAVSHVCEDFAEARPSAWGNEIKPGQTWHYNVNCNAGGDPEKGGSSLAKSEARLSPIFRNLPSSQDDVCQDRDTQSEQLHASNRPDNHHHQGHYNRLTVEPTAQNSYRLSTNWKSRVRAARSFFSGYFQGNRQPPEDFHEKDEEEEDRNRNAKPAQPSTAKARSPNGEPEIPNEGSGLMLSPEVTRPPATGEGDECSGIDVIGSLVMASAAVILATTMSNVVVQHASSARPLPSLCPVLATESICGQLEVKKEAEENKQEEKEKDEKEKVKEKEEVVREGGSDNVLNRLLTSIFPSTSTTTTTTTSQPSSPSGINHGPLTTITPSTVTFAITTPTRTVTSTRTTATTTPALMNTTQPVDMFALGDNALWSLLPSDRLNYYSLPLPLAPPHFTGTLSHPEEGGGSPLPLARRRPWSLAHRRLFSYVRRARGAWFRWRGRMEQRTKRSSGA